MRLAILMLARIVVGEAGFDATPEDVAAHHAVIVSRAERLGVSYKRAASLYAPRHVGVVASRRPWIAELDESMGRPTSWPPTASWSVHKPKWARLLELAGQVHRGELEHACDGEPHHWGGPVVDRDRIERGIARGYWRRIDCGPTRNVFLTLQGGKQ